MVLIMDYHPVEMFKISSFLCNWSKNILIIVIADDIAYVIDGNLPSNN